MRFSIIPFFLFTLLISAKDLQAKEILLTVITSNYTNRTYNLSIATDDKDEIVSIISKNNKKNKTKIYNHSLLSKEITLVKTLGISLVTLRCVDFDPQAGCRIKIHYPKNILLANFKDFDSRLRKVNGEWGLYIGSRKFTKLNLIAKKILGALVGIKRIDAI